MSRDGFKGGLGWAVAPLPSSPIVFFKAFLFFLFLGKKSIFLCVNIFFPRGGPIWNFVAGFGSNSRFVPAYGWIETINFNTANFNVCKTTKACNSFKFRYVASLMFSIGVCGNIMTIIIDSMK